jgi:hypothetical protein
MEPHVFQAHVIERLNALEDELFGPVEDGEAAANAADDE